MGSSGARATDGGNKADKETRGNSRHTHVRVLPRELWRLDHAALVLLHDAQPFDTGPRNHPRRRRRRCLHLHIGLPDAKLEGRILAARVPGIEASLRRQVVRFVQELRGLDLRKLPSVSETIDWARTVVLLHARELEPELVRGTLNVLLKFEADVEAAETRLGDLLRAARREADIRPAAQ